MSGQQRAKAGGEHGANGEWYEGGKFIATTDHPKADSRRQRRGSGSRVLVEPGKLEIAEAGHHAIFSQIRVFLDNDHMSSKGLARISSRFDEGHPAVAMYSHGLQSLRNLAERYNAGERWIKPEPATPVIADSDSDASKSAKARFLAEHPANDANQPAQRVKPRNSP